MILIWKFILGDATWEQLLDEMKDFADKNGDKNLDQLQDLLTDYGAEMQELTGVLARIQGISENAVKQWDEFLYHLNDERLRPEILNLLDAAAVLIDKTSSGDVSVNYFIRFFDITASKMAKALSKITDHAWCTGSSIYLWHFFWNKIETRNFFSFVGMRPSNQSMKKELSSSDGSKNDTIKYPHTLEAEVKF